jgi:hypothetical protein
VAIAFFVRLGFIFLMIQYLQVLAGQFSAPSASGPGSPDRNFELWCAYYRYFHAALPGARLSGLLAQYPQVSRSYLRPGADVQFGLEAPLELAEQPPRRGPLPGGRQCSQSARRAPAR